MIKLHTLGRLSLTGPDGHEILSVLAQPKRVAVLTYLALATPRGFHRRDTLLGLFWPELDQEHARGALNQALSFLRRSVGDAIETRGEGEVGLQAESFWCDAVAFEALLDAGEPSEALELYQGDEFASDSRLSRQFRQFCLSSCLIGESPRCYNFPACMADISSDHCGRPVAFHVA